MHKRPAADKFMVAAQQLRSKQASDDDVERTARALYPMNDSTDKTMRSRLRQAYLSSEADFAAAIASYDQGGNTKEIFGCLTRNSAAGAPIGNLNGTGKKRKATPDRFAGMWRAMSRQEQDAFLSTHNLSRRA